MDRAKNTYKTGRYVKEIVKEHRKTPISSPAWPAGRLDLY